MGLLAASRASGKRASTVGPLGVTKAGTLFCAPRKVASGICGLMTNWGVPGPGLLPPIDGCAWHMKQLLPLNLGPRPASGSVAGFPVTETRSPNLARPASQKLNDGLPNGMPGRMLPEEL